MALVEIRRLTKRYRKGDEVLTPLDDVDLEIDRGEFVSLMGPSGSGKSTLLNLLAGIDRADSGRIVGGGTDITRRRGLKPGAQFTIGEVSVYVAGVFRSAVAAEDSLIYTHLDFLQRTQGADATGQVTQLEVRLAEGAEPEAVAAAIDETFHAGPVGTTTRGKGVFQTSTLADLVDLVAFARWLGYGCLGLVLALVATTTVMAVQDRVRQHAVLETIGLRPARLFRLIVAESVLVCLLGGLGGTLLALAALEWGGLSVSVEGITVAFRPSVHLAMLGLLISLVVGILAGAIPAWQAARTKIVDALRQG